MNTYSREFIAMWCALGGLLGLLLYAGVENILDRRARREAAKRDRLDSIVRMGFRDAFMRGLIDERGNVIERVGGES